MKMLSLDDAIKAVTMLLDCEDDTDKVWSCDVINNLQYAPSVTDVDPGIWISVEDRLPEEDGTMRGYLVAVGDWVGIMAFYDGEFRAGLYDRKPDYPVHHWMPLPEPPEEVSC